MLRFFEKGDSCDILLDSPLEFEDLELLKELFTRSYKHWHVEFCMVYSIDAQMVELLYQEINENGKYIDISTHKHKLNNYLGKIGFHTALQVLNRDSGIATQNIEIILIGGSAGSSEKVLEAIKELKLTNLAVVIVQHIETEAQQLFDKILQNYTNVEVSYPADGERIKKGRIYLAPNGKHLKVDNGCFILSDESKYNFSKPSISVSYESFSYFYRGSLLVIQECGYLSDGVDKLTMLKANNTKIIIQDEMECEAKSMVLDAYKLRVHDYIFDIKNIIYYINFLNKVASHSEWVEYLLEMISIKYGYDFRLYQREMISRRISTFMIKHSIKSIKVAIEMILFKKSFFKEFFLEVSINVTEFFRDPNSYKSVIKILKNSCKNCHNIKIWSAGCSSGKEPYSLAILLHSMGCLEKSLIYATDFNSVILQEAKNGIYSNDAYSTAQKNFESLKVSENLDNYFTKNGSFVLINEEIRNRTLFLSHNLATDSSFNEFEMIVCKNVIIYFDDYLQRRVYHLFYDSLKFGGYLILGESESLHPLFRDKFEPYFNGSKIFKKVA